MRDPYFRNSGDGDKAYERRSRASQRASSKRMRELAAWSKRQEKEQLRAERQAQRENISAQKENLRLRQEEIINSVEEKNKELSEHIDSLRKVLEHTLAVNDVISFDTLKVKEEYPPFAPPLNLIRKYYPPSKTNFTVNPLNWFTRLIPGAEKRYGRKVRETEENYNAAVKKSKKQEAERNAAIEKLKKNMKKKDGFFS